MLTAIDMSCWSVGRSNTFQDRSHKPATCVSMFRYGDLNKYGQLPWSFLTYSAALGACLCTEGWQHWVRKHGAINVVNKAPKIITKKNMKGTKEKHFLSNDLDIVMPSGWGHCCHRASYFNPSAQFQYRHITFGSRKYLHHWVWSHYLCPQTSLCSFSSDQCLATTSNTWQPLSLKDPCSPLARGSFFLTQPAHTQVN